MFFARKLALKSAGKDVGLDYRDYMELPVDFEPSEDVSFCEGKGCQVAIAKSTTYRINENPYGKYGDYCQKCCNRLIGVLREHNFDITWERI